MSDFLQFLGVPRDADDETASLALTAMLTSAVRDDAPAKSLSEICHHVMNSNGSQYLDPLHALPLLLDSTDMKAQELVVVIGECSSPKEVLIATQECMERLGNSLQRDPDEEGEDKEKRAPIDVLVSIIDLYSAVIPKLKLRNRSALETIQVHLEELIETVDSAAFGLNASDSPKLLVAVCNLAARAHAWLNADPKSGKTDLLVNLLEHSLLPSARSLQSGVAQKAFEESYPRFKRPGAGSSSNEADDALRQVFDTFKGLGFTPKSPSEISLIALAHNQSEGATDPTIFNKHLPLLIASIHSNVLLDESLAVLIKFFCQPPRISIADETAGPLLSVLPELASGHPDPQVRHLAFRILSRVLALTPPVLRMQILADLTSNAEFPQLRVASIGLVKEALLEALNAPPSPFASPDFLKTFGPTIFRPNLSFATLDEFDESQEPKRLVECLSLYYVLLERDSQNLTGVRDTDVVKSVQASLLSPLREKMSIWESDLEVSEDGHGHHHFNPLLPLQIALDRVEGAKTKLQL